ncbi:unnamed protein product [Arctogadus glacialis]
MPRYLASDTASPESIEAISPLWPPGEHVHNGGRRWGQTTAHPFVVKCPLLKSSAKWWGYICCSMAPERHGAAGSAPTVARIPASQPWEVNE